MSFYNDALRLAVFSWAPIKFQKEQEGTSMIEQDQGGAKVIMADLGKYFVYLDDLRDSGETNMFEARPYLQRAFPGLSAEAAKGILLTWMQTFSERHPSQKEG